MKRISFENFFKLQEHGSTPTREVIAGITTFTAMSYIIFLQPMVMSGQLMNSPTGMDFGALLTGTCLASAVGCFLMGLLANYPIGLAPGMGANFFFITTLVPACALVLGAKQGQPQVWQLALGVVFISGAMFALMSLAKIRKLIMDSISPSLKYAIAGGIGLFVALLGLEHGEIITAVGGHYTLSKHLTSPAAIIFFTGLILTASLRVLKVHGAMLYGIVVSTIIAALTGEIRITHIFGSPASVAPIFGQADFVGVFEHLMKLLPLIIVLTFLDMFDTIGTLVGICAQAGLLKNNKLPRSGKAFTADAGATVFGAVCGHSSVTSFIESGAGVEAGGRTGMTAVIVGFCFLIALFFAPLVTTVAQYMPITAPALVIVGSLMAHNVSKIEWDDYSEAIPAFLILVGIPYAYSIADGMVIGFIAYPLLKLVSGKAKKCGPVSYILAGLLLLYVVFIRSKM
ncbi:NCS2 family permease [Lentisphaerota bacterium ZTH]|nr:NCS2 family permease [Lentisphaerota bacterium]WET06330.1 NCS2 family permease [Lentisphaerota bacterium ZTH]